MAFGALRIDALIIIEAADDEIEAVAGVIIAQLLRILILLRWVLRLGDDRQAGEVAIVFGLPVPIAPRGHRGDRKSVVSGKSVSVSVDLGGRRVIKQKKQQTNRK